MEMLQSRMDVFNVCSEHLCIIQLREQYKKCACFDPKQPAPAMPRVENILDPTAEWPKRHQMRTLILTSMWQVFRNRGSKPDYKLLWSYSIVLLPIHSPIQSFQICIQSFQTCGRLPQNADSVAIHWVGLLLASSHASWVLISNHHSMSSFRFRLDERPSVVRSGTPYHDLQQFGVRSANGS